MTVGHKFVFMHHASLVGRATFGSVTTIVIPGFGIVAGLVCYGNLSTSGSNGSSRASATAAIVPPAPGVAVNFAGPVVGTLTFEDQPVTGADVAT